MNMMCWMEVAVLAPVSHRTQMLNSLSCESFHWSAKKWSHSVWTCSKYSAARPQCLSTQSLPTVSRLCSTCNCATGSFFLSWIVVEPSLDSLTWWVRVLPQLVRVACSLPCAIWSWAVMALSCDAGLEWSCCELWCRWDSKRRCSHRRLWLGVGCLMWTSNRWQPWLKKGWLKKMISTTLEHYLEGRTGEWFWDEMKLN